MNFPLSIRKLTSLSIFQVSWRKSTRLLLVLQIFVESLRIHLIINISKFSPKVAVVTNTPPPLLNKTFQNLHLTPCCFEPFLDQGVSSSLSFPTFSTIHSQCRQVSCTLLFCFDPNPTLTLTLLPRSNKIEFFAIKKGSGLGNNVFRGIIVFQHCHIKTVRKNYCSGTEFAKRKVSN